VLKLRFAPFKREKEHTKALEKGIKEVMVTSAIQSTLEVREAVAKVPARREKEIIGNATVDGIDEVN
jgi:hypothetical protein